MIDVCISWFLLVFQIILVGLALDLIKRVQLKWLANRGLYKVRGIDAYIGTPIHEFGHYIFAKLFGFKVVETQFFPRKLTQNGDGTVTLGFVKWARGKKRLTDSVGFLFVGIAPFLSGSAVIVLVAYLLEPAFFTTVSKELLLRTVDTDLFRAILSNLDILITGLASLSILSWRFLVFILLTYMVANHITLSKPDLKIAITGLVQVSIIICGLSYFEVLRPYIGTGIGIISLAASIVLALCIVAQILSLIIVFIRCKIS